MADVSQADTRGLGEFTDQHGRVWEANTENKTRHPCGPYRPTFEAPFYPFNNYMDVKGTNRVVIQYQRWLDDLDTANAEYDQTLRNYAFQMYGDQAAQFINDPPSELIALAGERPMRVPREFIEASQAENKWILGFTPNVPEWAEPLIKREEEKKAPAQKQKYPDAGGVEVAEVKVEAGYELRMKSPGRWLMPDGSEFKGSREDAMDELKQNHSTELAEV